MSSSEPSSSSERDHCFDPRRTAILLLGGDKTGEWTGWYVENIPKADDLFDRYLQDLRDEGLLDD